MVIIRLVREVRINQGNDVQVGASHPDKRINVLLLQSASPCDEVYLLYVVSNLTTKVNAMQ